MKFKIGGRELEADGIRVRELCEAEKALQVNMSDGTGAAVAIQLFVALRREDKNKPAGVLADEVMSADITTFEEVEDESPPAEEPAASDGAGTTDQGSPPISGRQLSVRSA